MIGLIGMFSQGVYQISKLSWPSFSFVWFACLVAAPAGVSVIGILAESLDSFGLLAPNLFSFEDDPSNKFVSFGFWFSSSPVSIVRAVSYTVSNILPDRSSIERRFRFVTAISGVRLSSTVLDSLFEFRTDGDGRLAIVERLTTGLMRKSSGELVYWSVATCSRMARWILFDITWRNGVAAIGNLMRAERLAVVGFPWLTVFCRPWLVNDDKIKKKNKQ